MKTLSICIADSDAIRAETIKETLVEENYNAVVCKTETQTLKAVVETVYNIIFFSSDVSMDPFSFVNKLKSLSPKSHLVIINAVPQTVDIPPLMFAEMGIKHYIETPLTSTNYILDRVHQIEAEIMNEDDKLSLIMSVLNEAKNFARGEKKPGSIEAKKLLRKIGVLCNVFSPENIEEGKIKGSIKETQYYDVIRILGSIYEEGMLEIINESDRALLIMKNKAIVSAYITPGVRGIKAFLRIAEWNDGHFIFKNKITGTYGVEHDIAYVDVTRLCSVAKKTHEWFIKSKNNLPSKKLKVKLSPSVMGKNIAVTPKELDVLMTTVDHDTVSEILNYSSDLDTEIYESLISLRKKGSIEVKI
ncbi:MAG: DUF4388 domain-containing protein [bacterium]